MLIEPAIVTQVETDAQGRCWVWLSMQRKTACHGCDSGEACGSSALNNFFARRVLPLRLPDPSGSLQVGQQVNIGMQESALLQASVLTYLLPLLLMFVAGVLGELCLPGLGEGFVLLAAGGGLALGFALLRRFSAQKTQFQPVILPSP